MWGEMEMFWNENVWGMRMFGGMGMFWEMGMLFKNGSVFLKEHNPK